MIRSLKVFGLILFIAIAMPILAAENNISKSIVKVEGNVNNTPSDEISIILGIQTRNESLSIASLENSMQINQMIDAVISIGINENDIRKSNTSVQLEQWEETMESNKKQKVEKTQDFKVTNHIIIKMNKSEDVARVIDTATRLGANDILSISFGPNRLNLQQKQDQERIEEASCGREVIASSSETGLGNILNISSRNDSYGNYNETINAYAWYNNGNALLSLSKYDEAIEAYDSVLELDHNFTAALNNKGEALRLQGNYMDAIEAYDEAIQLDPLNGYIWSNKGLALYYQGKYNEAIKAFDEALKLHPEFELIWNYKDKAITMDTKLATTLIGKGLALYCLCKYDEAVSAYNKAIYINPELAIVWYGKGSALNSQGKYDEALKSYDKAIEIDPNYADAWYNKGIALLNLGNFDEANKCFDEAVEMDSGYGITWISPAGSTIRLMGPDLGITTQ